MLQISEYEPLATGRQESLFADDWQRHAPPVRDRFEGARIAVIGAAGSVGFAVARLVLQLRPAELVLLDLNENGLVEVARELKASPEFMDVPDEFFRDHFHQLPIGLGSAEFARYFDDNPPFDYILNLSAMKHVRTEKDVYCLMRMVDTNVLFLDEFLEQVTCRKFFSVSSDKAVNPANFLGASKMVMEQVLRMRSDRQPFSTARFANVAFSIGSLPYGFLERIRKGQPIGVQEGLRRYFMSHREAAELCVLSCALGENGDVYFPWPAAGADALPETTFPEILTRLLRQSGFEPRACETEREALSLAEAPSGDGTWPCHVSGTQTQGDKTLEEFAGPDDRVERAGYENIGVISRAERGVDEAALRGFLEFARSAKRARVTLDDWEREFQTVVPGFRRRAGTPQDHLRL